MKINIITQPLFCNYGGILQNYALQETLRRMGHDVLTINVPPREIVSKASWKDYVKSGINLIRRIQGRYDYPFLNPHTFAKKERELSGPQREFIKKYINKVDCQNPFTKETAQKYKADLWIVGSDQVWRPWCSPNISNYFFDFLDESTPRIAYAASFGTDHWEISQEQTEKIKELAKRFKAISVREKSGVDLCRERLNVEATHLLDPTMLLTASDYLALTKEKDYPKKPYIAAYILDSTPIKKRAIREDAKHYNLNVRPTGRMKRNGFDSIESWLATIAHAERVVTDSFHGTVFSLIFERPVRVLANSLRGNSRLQSLIDMLDLQPDADGFITMKKNNLTRLYRMRESSLLFLRKALTDTRVGKFHNDTA